MNILMLTSVYKDESLGERDTSTNIVNSFVKEWANIGHKVIVIHNVHCYPKLVHKIPHSVKKNLASKMGFSIADYDAVCKKIFEDSGAKVFRLPIKKYVPHIAPNKKEIDLQVKKIVQVLEKEDFIPEIITGHWASPQMEIISQLKDKYLCKTAVVLHGTGYIRSTDFNAQKYLLNIDRLGARSISQAKQIQSILNLQEMPFVCNSGVPDGYLKDYSLNVAKFENLSKWKFTYVGRLVAYKNIDATIRSLSRLANIDWEFNIVGEGAERTNLEILAKELHCENKVIFWGRVPRNQVMEILKDTHIFVMISTNEIFGLVYLEAMAASCITIASKNGGVDGIIKNGENGFLCDEGNAEELTEIIQTIILPKSSEELRKIAQNGYNTVEDYSDSNVAKMYLNNIIK